MRRTAMTLAVFTLALLMCAPAFARPGRGKGRGGGMKRHLAKHLYPPEMLMRFQDDLALTSTQRKTLLKEMKATQSKATDLKFALHGEAQKLTKLLAADRVSEKKALAQSDKVMGMERKMKRLHLRLLVRIKNMLTAEQKATLDKVKAKWRSRMNMHAPPQPPSPPTPPSR